MTTSRTAKPNTSTAAKILYRPFGILSSVAAGLLASLVFRTVWHKAVDPDRDDPPKALESEYRLREVLLAAFVQGALYAVVKALTDRGGAKLFEKATGEWPGS